MAQVARETGNTKVSRVRCRNWLFTINNPIYNDESLKAHLFDSDCEKFIFKKEKGKEGTEHYHIVACWKNPKEFNSVKKIFPEAHIDKIKNLQKAIDYVKKDETTIGIINSHGMPKELKIIEVLNDWQKEAMEILKNDAEDRCIHWFWEEVGNVGKTSFAKYLVVKHKALFVSGKGADIKYALCLAVKKNPDIDLVIFHYTRTQEEYISYTAMEEVKDGIFFSGKYEAEMVVFNSPHIFVFANFEPDRKAMSADRWKIHYIGKMISNSMMP